MEYIQHHKLVSLFCFMLYPLTPCVLCALGTPTVSHLEHRDLTEMNNISGYGMILCNSSHYPPTKITWKRDGLPLNDNGSYEQMQIVINRESSEYMNVLILKSVFDVMRSFVYTCIISNRIGEVSHDIQLTNIGNT